jgi:hypothetical protein
MQQGHRTAPSTHRPGAPVRGPFAAITAELRSAFHELFDTYRPERHYMRGPGPKWHAKHPMELPSAVG